LVLLSIEKEVMLSGINYDNLINDFSSQTTKFFLKFT